MSRSRLAIASLVAAGLAACGTTSATGTPVPLPPASNTPTAVPATPTAPPPSATADPTAGWTVATSPDGRFSVHHPSTLIVVRNCQTILILDVPGSELADCDQQGFQGQPLVEFDSISGDHRSDASQYAALASDPAGSGTPVTVAGVTGSEYMLTFTGDGQGHSSGEKQLVDVFFTADQTYVAAYTEDPAKPDLTSTFHLMVGTLTFG
jgi:hypothetical protein